MPQADSIRQAVALDPREAPPFEGVVLGAGRSGVVFKTRDASGEIVARKVFDSDPLTKAVQYLFLGSPNPYAWNSHAARAAVLRRRVAQPLVEHWFGSKLSVAGARGASWNERYRVFQMDTEFIEGAPPTLHHPMNQRGASEVRDLWDNVMRPLQQHLEDSGLDGLVWQAGRGNPTALANFLCTRSDSEVQWVWIDLESGVPALFPANPLELVRFYLPRAWRYRRPLFDDTDIPKLKQYLRENAVALGVSLGRKRLDALHEDVSELRFHQDIWKTQPRLERGIAYNLAKQNLTEDQAEFFRTHPLHWYAHEARRLPTRSAVAIGKFTAHVARRLWSIQWRHLPLGVGRFLISQNFRANLAQCAVAKRIDSWQRRDQLLEDEADRLRARLASEESSSYLTDFGAHLAIKPFIKGVEWLVFGSLFAAGLIDETTLTIAVLSGGSIGRTLYTTYRFFDSLARKRELPWIALGVGVLPVLGNLAYPLQLVATSREEDDILAQFILYDSCTLIGRKLPIWGGKDTLTEHAFNHLPDRIVRGRG